MNHSPRKSSENEIQFKPLNEGLGFHPFSEGLPYSPSSKTRQSPAKTITGTGAIAAGAPSFSRTIPQISQPKPAVPVTFPAEPVPVKNTRNGFAYLCRRVSAYLFDSIINLALCGIALGWALWKQNIQPDFFLNPEVGSALLLFMMFFNWALITAQEIAFGSSTGKRLFGLKIPGPVSMLLLRSFLFLVGFSFCGVGLLWAIFDRDRRCWHDLATGMQPVAADSQ